MSSKKKFISVVTLAYTLFILISVPYIRFFQDYVKSHDLVKIYDYALYGMCFFLVAFVFYNIFLKRKVQWKNILAYGATGLIFAAGLSIVHETVERIHFIQYGFLVLLLFNVLRSRIDDLSIYVWTFLLATCVGVLDEWIQWWVPSRFGEIRDIYINLIAILVGLACIHFLWRPTGIKNHFPRSRWRTLLVLLTLLLFEITAFIHCTHLGYLIHDSAIGSFHSRFSRTQLIHLSSTRDYPREEQILKVRKKKFKKYTHTHGSLLEMWQKEDFYKTEAQFHTGARNRLFDEGHYFESQQENAILEKYYRPLILDSDMRWGTQELKLLQSRRQSQGNDAWKFSSSMQKHIWIGMSKTTLWGIYGIIVILLIIISKLLVRFL